MRARGGGPGVSMAKGGDIIRLGKALRSATADIEKTLPAACAAIVQDHALRPWPARSMNSSGC